MSQVALFLFGCMVSLIVATAVALLVWSAAHEPHAGEQPRSDATRRPRRPAARPTPLEPAHTRNPIRMGASWNDSDIWRSR